MHKIQAYNLFNVPVIFRSADSLLSASAKRKPIAQAQADTIKAHKKPLFLCILTVKKSACDSLLIASAKRKPNNLIGVCPHGEKTVYFALRKTVLAKT